MTAHPTWFAGNRQPPIADTIRDAAGNPLDLTGKSFRFRAREIGSATLLVDQPVSNTLDTTGIVEYEWSAADVGAGGALDANLAESRQLLVWWVDEGGPQDVNEAIVVVAVHKPLPAYVELEAFKSAAYIQKSSRDEDIKQALVAASRGLDSAWNRGYSFLEGAPGEVRYFSSDDRRTIRLDPVIDVSELAFDYYGRDEFATVIPSTDYRLQPTDAADRLLPYREIYLLGSGANWGAPYWGAGIRVTGTFGFPAIPPELKSATTIVAARLLERTTSAPFGIIAFGQEAAAVRAGELARDPEVRFLMTSIGRRKKLFV